MGNRFVKPVMIVPSFYRLFGILNNKYFKFEEKARVGCVTRNEKFRSLKF